MKETKAESCQACNGRGWLIVATDGNQQNPRVERCDGCLRFKTDADALQWIENEYAALEAVAEAAQKMSDAGHFHTQATMKAIRQSIANLAAIREGKAVKS